MHIDPTFEFTTYQEDGKILIGNPLQAARYHQYGAIVYDIVRDGDKWFWTFDANAVKGLFDSWCRRELPPKE